MVLLWTVFPVVLALARSSSNIQIVQPPDQLVECLQTIVNEISPILTNGIRISIETESHVYKRNFRDALDRLLVNNELIVDIDSKDNSLLGTEVRFFFIDSLKAFKYLFECQDNLNESLGIGTYHFAILPFDISFDKRQITSDIIDYCLKNYIINVNVLQKDANGEILLYTYYPYTEISCNDSTPIIHNRFVDGSFQYKKMLFPLKVTNLWHCPIRVATRNIFPYVIIKQNMVSGIVGNFVNLLAEKMNFSLKVIEMNESSIIFQNKTLTGGYKLVNERKADINVIPTTSSLYGNLFFSHSPIYYFTHIYAVVKRSEPYNFLEILILPFDMCTWIIMSLLYVAKYFCGYIISPATNNIHPNSENAFRISRAAWAFSFMILRSSYEGTVFGFMKNSPAKAQLQNLNEVIADGYKFIANPVVSNFFHGLPELKNRQVPSNKSIEKVIDELDQYDGKYAAIIPRECLPVYNNDTSRSLKYFIIPTPVTSPGYCLHSAKRSFLTLEMNELTLRIVEYAHIERIIRNNIAKLKKKFKKLKMSDDEFHKISLHKFSPLLYLYAVMVGISFCVYLIEILSVRFQKLRQLIEFLQ